MIQSYKGRNVHWPQRLKVYRNLHKAQWSLVAFDGPHRGLVVGHADELWIKDATFKVSAAGRERTIREGKKNVHAWIIGALTFAGQPVEYARTRITYNPFKQTDFQLDGFPGSGLISAKLVHLDGNGKAWSVHPLDIGAPKYGR